uniref:SH3 domain-containing protein n=1 Tax=Wuchereria bancrofti TaxID=6293 RepID=A0A1I8EST2_WUCBA
MNGTTVTLWDDCCEYAQQINEIARIWIEKSSDTSNISEIINTQQTSTTIYPKSDNLTNSTMEAIALNNQCLPVSLPVDEIDNQIMNGTTVTLWDDCCEYAQQINEIARIWIEKSSDTSNISEIINTQQTSTTIYPKSDNLTNSTMEAIALNNQCLPVSLPVDVLANLKFCNVIKHSSQECLNEMICFGTDSVMSRSVLMFDDNSYYDDNNLNDNQISSRKVLSQFGQDDSSVLSQFGQDDSSGVSSCCTGIVDQFNPTHRVHSSFIPRHDDEVLLEIGDAIHITGINLRTNQRGIFPSAHVCEIDLVEEICMGALPSNVNQTMTNERDTFYLTMLASIEVAHHKGNDILIQAMNKKR